MGKRQAELNWNIGTWGNVLVGGGAAFAFWAFKLLNPDPQTSAGAAVVCGFVGGRLLAYIAERELFKDENAGLQGSLAERGLSVDMLLDELEAIVEINKQGRHEEANEALERLSKIQRLSDTIEEEVTEEVEQEGGDSNGN